MDPSYIRRRSQLYSRRQTRRQESRVKVEQVCDDEAEEASTSEGEKVVKAGKPSSDVALKVNTAEDTVVD